MGFMKDKEKQIFEFKVIDKKTGKEADIGEIALKEDWAKGLMYCDMEGFAITQDNHLILLDECGKYEFCSSDRFEIIPKDSVVLSREEHEILVKTAQGKIGNMKATDFLKACISSGFMVEAVSTEEKVKQAYEKGSKETAEKIYHKIKIKVLTEDMAEYRPQTLYRFTGFDIMKMAREIVEEFGVVFENGHTTIKE
jgi:hypothetical protein